MIQRLLPPKETIVFSGKIGEVVHTEQSDGRVFERYRRPPGTRLIIVSPDKKILITREHRLESGNIDLRLPGGKLRDSLVEYHELLHGGQDLTAVAQVAATKEALEETGLIVKNSQLITKANNGATVEWDLYYFLVNDYEVSPAGQQLEPGENIEITWMTPQAIRQAIGQGEMQEWRSAGVLLGIVLPELEAQA
jgi:ADP-ribose pyrophosphatase